MASEFVHLHNHSDYSLLDGAQTVSTLINTIDDLGMDSVALTEHGNMFSTIAFYQKAGESGINPIIGCEIYVAQGSRFDKKPKAEGGWGNNHLLLLAQNYTGYKNLMKLVTHGYLEGFYYRPRIDMDLLKQHSEGIICCSGCLKGEVPEKMLKGDWEGAKATALQFAEMFPGRYYLEVQNHGIEEESANVENMVKLAKELDLPLVATNDAHYARKEHWQAHDIHLCLGTGKERNDPNRLRYATSEFYFKTQDEMHKMFKHVPGAIENTRRIAESIDISIPLGQYHLPHFPIPENGTSPDPDDYLRTVAYNGMKKLYGKMTPSLQLRLDHELTVIKKMGFAGYFLITMDFVKYAKNTGVPVGPGRGSAAGSIVAFALGITTVDPIRYNLLFERFLNPERTSLPDIDIDFCVERRGEVIDYIRNQYGENSVTQIITFGKLKARQVVRDVGRVLGRSYGDMDKLAKMIPFGPGVTLGGAIEKSQELKDAAEGDYKEVIEHSLVLEGMNRHASTHAAGVVIAPGELTDFVPLYKSPQGDITSQYDMKGLESLGLLKMDFLGLRNLTVIEQAVKLIKDKGENINIDKLPLDDPKVYKLFAKGLTIGVFQFESSGMREFLKKLKPTQIEDLIAMNALYRPGPMQNIDDFIKRKHGKKDISYLHPKLEPILEETYGIIVYQEQVMQIANEIAGYSLAEADIMRRAMGKKIKSLMKEQKVKFISGARDNGFEKKDAEEIYSLIEKFAQYGFNKSHSTAYAIIAYQTAWLKAHHPAEFMAANLTSEMGKPDRVVILINECRKLGIKVDPPDINVSEIHFKPVDKKTIAFGLNAIKNVGSKALENILIGRTENKLFSSLFDFCTGVDLGSINKKVLESLIKSGAMDSLNGNRATKYSGIDLALRYGQQVQDNKRRKQVDLFGGGASDGTTTLVPEIPKKEKWTESDRLEFEKEVTGMYVSGHPLLKYAADLEDISTFDFSDETENAPQEKIRLGGMVGDIKKHFDKKNRQMAFFQLECIGGHVEILVFADTFERYKELIIKDKIIIISGRPTDKSDFSDLKLIADELIPIETARDYFSKRVNIRVETEQMRPDDVDALFDLSSNYQGKCGLVFHLMGKDGRKQKVFAHNIKVSSSREYLEKLRDLYGKSNIWVE